MNSLRRAEYLPAFIKYSSRDNQSKQAITGLLTLILLL